jgi:hypothetical protein
MDFELLDQAVDEPLVWHSPKSILARTCRAAIRALAKTLARVGLPQRPLCK